MLQLFVVKLITLILSFPHCGSSHQLEDVIYVDCINGTLDTACWAESADLPCASLEVALQGAELLNTSVFLAHPGQCAINSRNSHLVHNQVNKGLIMALKMQIQSLRRSSAHFGLSKLRKMILPSVSVGMHGED